MIKPQLWVLTCLAALASAPAVAQDREPGWVRKPSMQDLQSVWPMKALKGGYGGRATLSCTVTVQGTLRACSVLSESPAQGGFGSAPLTLASQFAMRPALKAGAPVEAEVRIPIVFPEPEKSLGSHLVPETADTMGSYRIYSRLPWRQAPTYAEMVAVYPAKARAAKVGGAAVLDCRIGKAGDISGCHTLRETPDGQGFGAAAKLLAPRFLGPAADAGGQTLAGAHVHLPIVFPAAALEAGAPAIGKPQFVAMPSLSDFTAVISPAARQAQVYKARVMMTCAIGAEGALRDCAVETEEPVGLGYADAALRLAGYFRVGIWTEEGLPTVGGKLRLPLRFDLESAVAAAAR